MEGGDNVRHLLSDYEDVISSLQSDLEFTKKEHKILKDDLLQLMSENRDLSSKLDAAYRERLQETSDENFKSEIVINLQSQLDLSKREKERILELYKSSLKLIEKLEEEVSGQDNVIEKKQTSAPSQSSVVSALEAKLKTTKEHLEMALAGREQMENENLKQQTEIAKLKLNLESNNKVIEQLKQKEEDWRIKCLKLEQDYTLLNATFECVVESRNELEKKLETYAMKIQELLKKNGESRNKVEEALDLVEKALAEKDSAAVREESLRGEVNKLHMCLEHVINEAGKKVGVEVEEARKKYESNIKDLLSELSELKRELEKKKLELKRLSVKHKKLEKLASGKLDKEKISLIKGSETEITILENHLDSTYQELERFKAKHDEVVREKKKLQDEFSGLVERHDSTLKEKEARERLLEETVEKLKFQIEAKIEDLNDAAKRSEFFLDKVKVLQVENDKLSKAVKNCECDKLKEKIRKLNAVWESQRQELETHVESQMKLNESWKNEVKEMSEKFEEKIRELKKECGEAKAKYKKVVSELNVAKKKILLLENV